jgi:hypothetical protein
MTDADWGSFVAGGSQQSETGSSAGDSSDDPLAGALGAEGGTAEPTDDSTAQPQASTPARPTTRRPIPARNPRTDPG